LAANILNITKSIGPHLHIVDAMFTMDGLGPTRGTPVRANHVIIGNDPYCIDLLTAKYARFDYIRKLLMLVRPLTAKHTISYNVGGGAHMLNNVVPYKK